MDIKFSTTQLDASLVLGAYKAFKDGNFESAGKSLLEILDVEPRNWQARLLLACCYSKSKQNFAAQRALRFVYENCSDDPDLKAKACLALQSLNAKMEAEKGSAAEFGRFNDGPGGSTHVSIE